ncbi:tetratricopeptide repeat protein [Catellatospora methionotrophica]|uniref:tetratricopeptide repeat protein n=1 Tax=Catellatospora methionotrophica TaxID=121620 RepID=UPI0033D0BAB2
MPEGGRLARARELVSRLDFPAAQQLLRDQLVLAHQDPRHADTAEADTAALYAGVLLHLGEPHAARSWAAYAHAAAQALHGDLDRRTLHALGVLAVCMHRTGALDRAGDLYQDLIDDLSATEGPDADRTLSARADAAVVAHARGSCAEGRRQLSEVLAAHVSRHGPGHPVNLRMTIRLAGMWRDCGDFDQAHDLLARAREQAAALPAADDVHRLLQAAAQAPARTEHRCGTAPSEDEAGRAHDPGPGVLPVLIPHADDLIPGPHQPAPRTAEPGEWPDDEIFERYDDPSRQTRARSSRPVGAPPPRHDDTDARLDDLLGQGGSGPGRRELNGDPAGAGQATRDRTRSGSPVRETARNSHGRERDRAAAGPEDTDPGQPAGPLYRPAGRPYVPVDPAYPIATTPPPGLLTPPRTPPAARRRRGGGAAALAVVAAVVAIVALVGTFILATGSGPDEASPSPAASPSGPAPSAPPPVTGLTVADLGTRLRITWSYPDGATAAVVLSAAPAGQPMRALQSLPAGTETVTLPGFDKDRDYCVTVTLAYSADRTVMSPPVCTDRRRSPAARP